MARLRMTRAQLVRHIRDALPLARDPYATFQLDGRVVVTTVTDGPPPHREF
jgi:hypothetical protein